MFLRGVDATTLAGTFSNGVYIPEYAFVAFQMTFDCLTPALVIGAFAERMRFSAVVVWVVLWVTVVYFPLAHMVWYWPRSEEHTSELQTLMRTSYAVFCLKQKCTSHSI